MISYDVDSLLYMFTAVSMVFGAPDRIEALTVKSLIRRTFVGNEIVDHSDIVGASPVGAAPTTSSFST